MVRKETPWGTWDHILLDALLAVTESLDATSLTPFSGSHFEHDVHSIGDYTNPHRRL